jgi:cytochrome c2
VKHTHRAAGISVLAIVLTFAQNSFARKSEGKKSNSSASAARGQTVFENRCAMCHYNDRIEKKIGPGLKDIYKRGTFAANGNKINDESLKTWIQNGDLLMPPFKDVLDVEQIKDLIAYIKTL